MNTLRKSFRRKKGVNSANSLSPNHQALVTSSPGSLCFHVSISDLSLEFSPLYQPTGVVVSVRRHRKRWSSDKAFWEASLKSPREGFCFWHPPFATAVTVTDAAAKKKGGGADGNHNSVHKDVFLSVEDVDQKGKRKLLAKARVDLWQYRGDGGEQARQSASKIKLYPETKKVAKAYANVTIKLLKGEEAALAAETTTALGESLAATPADGLSLTGSVDSGVGRHKPEVEEEEERDLENDSIKLGEEDKEEEVGQKSILIVAKKQISQFEEDPPPSPPSSPKASEVEQPPLPEPVAVIAKDSTHQTEKDVQTSTTVKTRVEKKVSAEVEHVQVEGIAKIKEVKELLPKSEETKKTTSLKLTLSSAANPLTRVTGDRLRLSQRSQDANQNDILGWAKARLKPYPQVKITNLHSSWQNGLGFCALIHSRYPDLIPVEALKPREVEANFNLTLQACQVIGVNIPNLLQDLKHGSSPGLNVKTTARFLTELKRVFDDETAGALSPSDVEEFRKKAWMVLERKSRSEDDSTSSLPVLAEEKPEESQDQEVSANEESQEEQDKGDLQEAEEEQKPMSANRKRALEMIKDARRAESVESESNGNDGGSVQRTLNHRESRGDLGQISNELGLLELENDRLDHEQEMLAKIIRDGSKESADRVLPRYLQLVNEKNGLVRRQMQLNLFEKEAELAKRQSEIQARLQKLSEVEDEKKTEAVKQEEAKLLDELVQVVNQKNELVIHLDNQEQGIHEDQTIQDSLMAGGNDSVGGVNIKKPEECVLQ